MNKVIVKTVLNEFTHDGFNVRVIWVEYAGGAMSYEFEILENGSMVYMSEDGYGQALPAAAAAYDWLNKYE